MASNVRASGTFRPDSAMNTSSIVGAPDEVVPGLLHLADDHLGPEPGLPLIRADPPEQQIDQGRLPRTVRTDEGHPFAERELHVDRTEPEVAPVDDRA